MRYRLPDSCERVTLGGVTLDRASDGTVQANAAAAEHLAPHGIVPADEPGEGKPRDALPPKTRGKP